MLETAGTKTGNTVTCWRQQEQIRLYRDMLERAGANQVIKEHIGESRSKSGNTGTCWREQEQIR